MKIARCDIFRYDLPLSNPLTMMGRTINKRSGLILLIHDEKGYIGAGEVAPLPGLHKEDLTDAQDYLYRMIKSMIGFSVPEDLPNLANLLNHILEKPAPASVRFGIEQALLILLCHEKGIPLYQFLFKTYRDIVKVNGLLTGSVDEIIRGAREYVRDGYSTLKLKVGHRPINEDIRIVELIRRAIGGKISLRLDANQSWSLEEAVFFGKVVYPYHVEYIEEPTSPFDVLSEFYQQTGVPIALDESLLSCTDDGSKWPLGTSAIILKPSLIGGILKTMELADRAKQAQIVPVVSCAFLSGFSLAVLTQLSAGLGDPGTAMGLDTYRWLQYDILQKPFCVENGQVNVRTAAQILMDLRFDQLVKLSLHNSKLTN